jgi:hypothetical protein
VRWQVVVEFIISTSDILIIPEATRPDNLVARTGKAGSKEEANGPYRDRSNTVNGKSQGFGVRIHGTGRAPHPDPDHLVQLASLLPDKRRMHIRWQKRGKKLRRKRHEHASHDEKSAHGNLINVPGRYKHVRKRSALPKTGLINSTVVSPHHSHQTEYGQAKVCSEGDRCCNSSSTLGFAHVAPAKDGPEQHHDNKDGERGPAVV